MNDMVRTIRKNIAEAGGSELKAMVTNDGLKQLWQAKQDLIAQMNSAKKAAAEEAAKPFQDQIAEIDIEYAFLLQMIGENGENR